MDDSLREKSLNERLKKASFDLALKNSLIGIAVTVFDFLCPLSIKGFLDRSDSSNIGEVSMWALAITGAYVLDLLLRLLNRKLEKMSAALQKTCSSKFAGIISIMSNVDFFKQRPNPKDIASPPAGFPTQSAQNPGKL